MQGLTFSDTNQQDYGLVTIRSGPFEASFSVMAGGRLLQLMHRAYGDVLVPMDEHPYDEHDWPKAGAFPLFPYHGRLKNAAVVTEQQSFQLRGNPYRGGDAMHGPAQRRPWRIDSHSSCTLSISLEYEADEEWPYDFKAHQHFSISDRCLDVGLSLVNTSDRPSPGGIGWHPYFAIASGVPLSCDAQQCWTLPPAGSGDSPAATPLESTSFGVDPQSKQLSNWSRASFLTSMGLVSLFRKSALEYLVLHRTATYACLEPVSHLSGAFSLPRDLRPTAGIRELAPGETMLGSISILVGP
ncbi:hypothetical protein [Rhizobium sp. Nf11,1]|uniref:aldose epimerase family protein n=1 Tax=Rhizobium sp. Nf11,1 TaxID=3404923 RepID=UPI003D348693